MCVNNLDLICGKELEFNGITFKHPTLSEIIEVGEEYYSSCISIFTLKPYDLMVQLYDSGIDYATIDCYELFIMLCSDTIEVRNERVYFNNKSEASKKLAWLTGVPDFRLATEGEEVFLYSELLDYKLDKPTYYIVRKYYNAMNYFTEKNEFNPANETTRKFLIQEKRDEQRLEARKKNREKESTMGKYISCLVWSSGILFEKLYDMKIYQIIDGVVRLDKIREHQVSATSSMTAYYAGNIKKNDFKKIRKDLNWMS